MIQHLYHSYVQPNKNDNVLIRLRFVVVESGWGQLRLGLCVYRSTSVWVDNGDKATWRVSGYCGRGVRLG